MDLFKPIPAHWRKNRHAPFENAVDAFIGGAKIRAFKDLSLTNKGALSNFNKIILKRFSMFSVLKNSFLGWF